MQCRSSSRLFHRNSKASKANQGQALKQQTYGATAKLKGRNALWKLLHTPVSRDRSWSTKKKHDHCHCCDCIVSFLSSSKAHAARINLGTFLYTTHCSASSYQSCSHLMAARGWILFMSRRVSKTSWVGHSCDAPKVEDLIKLWPSRLFMLTCVFWSWRFCIAASSSRSSVTSMAWNWRFDNF